MTNAYLTRPRTLNRWSGAGLLAAALGASFLYVRAKARQAEKENPPTGRFIEVDGVRLHYKEQGDGPAVLLLHGNGVYSIDFEASGLVQRLAAHHRVILVDRPGYGYSERPRTTVWTPHAQAQLLLRALDQIGVEQPVVVAHSWGTTVALSMALARPHELRGLVLLGGYYYPSLRLDVPLLSPPAIPIIGDIMRYTISPLVTRALWPALSKQMFSPRPVPASFQRMPVWMMLRPSQLRAGAAESAMMVPSAMLLKRHYRQLAVPVALVAGSGDLMSDPSHNSGRLHGEVAHSTLRIEPDTGHMIHYAHPELVEQAIDDMIMPAARRPDLAAGEQRA
ncbi:MAG TPA: alpha/beta hydrolase [Telluria sp.]